ncbi:DUF317 domain-containing protein [Kitasatospora sp. NPDC050463]|uniref:DUF317 domain-containing protein n=1 Tax=Kitasatospora sp. NPDC050463 TaxID=3155786 RepID=UPI0033CFEC3F
MIARRGGVLVTAELAHAGIRDDTFNGIRIRAVVRETGAELGSNRFDFDTHATVPNPGFVHRIDDLDRMHRFGELTPELLQDAIDRYLDLYTDAPPGAPGRHRVAPALPRADTAGPTRKSVQDPSPVLVSPLYLAGPAGPRELATAPLLEHGWSVRTDRSTTTYTSPSTLHHVVVTPESAIWAWTITGLHHAGGPPAWRAAADAKTPPEIIAALTTAVTQLPGPRDPRRALPPSTAALDQLAAAGWQRLPHLPDDIIYVEPVHGLARVSRSLPAAHHAFRRDDWHINGGRLNLGPREGWYIEMDSSIPSPLLAAVTGALLDRTPVERPRHSLADEHLPHLDITTVQPDRTLAAGRASAARSSTATPAALPAPAPARIVSDATASKARGR